MVVMAIDWVRYFEALKIPFIILVCTVVGTVILCLFLNWETSVEDKEHACRQEEVKKGIMPNWSLENAMRVNRETCNYTPGDVRLNMGLYRTPEEADKYIEESLKKPLP